MRWIRNLVLSLILLTKTILAQYEDPRLKGSLCYKQMADIAFLLDTSVSIYEQDFTKELLFVKQLLEPLPIGDDGIQTSVSTFGSDTVTHIYLDDFNKKEDLVSAIDDIKYRGGQTKTDVAIAHARDVVFKAENGYRKGAERLIVVVTDGLSTDNTRTVREAEICRDLGIKVISVGVGHGVNVSELRSIASQYNNGKLVFTVDDFDGLESIVEVVTKTACDVMLQDTPTEGDEAQKYCRNKPADVYFAIDSSSSVLNINYQQILHFLSNVVGVFDIGPEATRVGVISYSDHVHPVLRLDTTYDKSVIIDRLMRVPIYGGKTKTGSALHYLRRNAFKRDYIRSEVAHVIILVTDGQSSDTERVLREADLLRKFGVYIFVVGVGPQVDVHELRLIASSPADKFVFLKKDASMLSQIGNLLAARTCSAPETANSPPGQLDSFQGNEICINTERKYTLFVYDQFSFSSKSNNILKDFVDKMVDKLSDSNLEYDWMTKPREDVLKKHYTQNEVLASLLKAVRIHGFNTGNFVHHSLIVFINNSIENDFSTMILELRRLNFFLKANVILVYVGHGNIRHMEEHRRHRNMNWARIVQVPSINDIHVIKHTLIEAICPTTVVAQ